MLSKIEEIESTKKNIISHHAINLSSQKEINNNEIRSSANVATKSEISVTATNPSVPVTNPDDSEKPTFLTIKKKALIPKLTEKGRIIMDDLSTPTKIYSFLKMIDNHSSVFEIFEKNNIHKNFLEFLLYMQEIDMASLVTFIKTKNINKKSGWVKIGDILLECDLIHEVNLRNAANYKKTTSGMLIGEAMIELRFITENVLRDALKIQKWLAHLIDKSLFLTEMLQSNSMNNKIERSLIESAGSILDFIIPILADAAKVLMSKPENRAYAMMLNIIDGNASLYKIFEDNKKVFNFSKLEFFKFILKLDAQELLLYRKNEGLETREAWLKFGQIAVELGLVNEAQIDETFRYRHELANRMLHIGEALVELKYLTKENLEECLKILRWCNTILAKISYETSLITSINEVLSTYLNFPTEMGKFAKVSFNTPLTNIICITFNISGNLNGQVFYIFDRSFFENLTDSLIVSYHMKSNKMDESFIAEICNMITGSSLTKLSKIGIFCETTVPEVITDKEVIIANKQTISALPLLNKFGRFIIGFLLKT